MTDDKKKQQQMHKEFFDNCDKALEHKFYMEAILMEYAAIEGRMEILLGVLGLPCDRFGDYKSRKAVQISHRINCANKIRKSSQVFEGTKLGEKYFEKLGSWINKRNEYIHGLYKNELKYSSRMANAKNFAVQGREYCRLLYNEVNRLKRLKRRHPERFDDLLVCGESKCSLNPNRKTDDSQ